MSIVCQYLTLHRVLVVYKCVHCCFYSMSTVFKYLTLDRVLVLYKCVYCCILEAVHCLSVPQNVSSVGSVSVCPLLSSRVCPPSVSASNCIVCWFCVIVSTAVFYSLSNVCQYLKLYRRLVLCHYVHCCLLQAVQFASVIHTIPYVTSLSVCPLLSSTVSPLSVSTSNWYVGSLPVCPLLSSTVCPLSVSTSQYKYRLLVLCQYVHSCLLQSVHCLSLPHIQPSFGSALVCPKLSSTVCPISVIISQCIVCWFFVHCCLLQFVHSLSVPHTTFADCHQTADCTATITPPAASQWQLWQTWL